jgi:hypothetical protein
VEPHVAEVGEAVPQLSPVEASHSHPVILPDRESLAIRTDQV